MFVFEIRIRRRDCFFGSGLVGLEEPLALLDRFNVTRLLNWDGDFFTAINHSKITCFCQ